MTDKQKLPCYCQLQILDVNNICFNEWSSVDSLISFNSHGIRYNKTKIFFSSSRRELFSR